MRKVKVSSDTVYSRFTGIVSKMPTAIALDDGARKVSYASLDAFANSIAARISVATHGQQGIVAILTEDRVAAVAAMIGVACSGQAYVVLDAGDPELRLRSILRDCRPFVLLADASQAERAKALSAAACEVVELVESSCDSVAIAQTIPPKPDSLLCLLYTSGSTGQPKGVRQTHRNLLFFVDAYAKTLEIVPRDRLSLLFTLSFSAANMDIYGALLYGATLCPYVMRTEGIPKLAGWIERNEISILHTVPTVLRALTRTLNASQQFPHIRSIDVAGEALFADDVSRFMSHVGSHCIFANHLAAAEASVIAQNVLRRRDPLPTGRLPVGGSPSGVTVQIVRNDGGAADPDEVGRIAIDSPYLSPGYWNRPELNQTAFSELPERPGWRRYLTEDLGSIDGAGDLHFIGRRGSRVKLRGNSIDLNEVGAALLACDGVSEAAVLAHGEPGKEADRLVAFLVMVSGNTPSPLVLRQQLLGKVPAYMLPSGYVFRHSLPHTATGKLDRRAMAELLSDTETLWNPDYEEPADDLERQVADIFSQVLNCKPIGRFDDFFLLGGDSISLVALQLQLRETFGHDLPDLHSNATVTQIADRIRTIDPAKTTAMSRLVPLRPEGVLRPLFIVHGGLGQAFVSPHFVGLFDHEQPLFAIQAKGLDGREKPCRTVEEMAEEYVAAVRQRQPQGPYFLAAMCAGAYVAIEMADLLRSAGQEVLPLLLFDPPPSIDARRVIQLSGWRPAARQIEATIRNLAAQGRNSIDINDRHVMQASIQVARAFGLAIARHRPRGHQGGAFVFLSHEMHRNWTQEKLLRVFPMGAEFLIVAGTHSDALNPANPDFEEHVRACLWKIQHGFPPANNLANLKKWNEQSTSSTYRRWWRIRELLRL